MGQSSNDVFPSAVHLAALAGDLRAACCRRSTTSATRSPAKAEEFADVVKAGRTHLMDAVPVTLGQEFAGYAAQVRQGRDRVADTLAAARPDPARRHGHRHRPEHPPRVRRARARAAGRGHRPADRRARPTRSRRRAPATRLVEASGALKVVAVSLTKIANDIAWMGSGPRCGLGEIFLPELQKGSSIMPGKVNPVIPEVVMQVAAQVIGNDTAITDRRACRATSS